MFSTQNSQVFCYSGGGISLAEAQESVLFPSHLADDYLADTNSMCFKRKATVIYNSGQFNGFKFIYIKM